MKMTEIVKRNLRRMPSLRRAIKRLLLIDYIQNRDWHLENKLVYSYIATLEERVRRLEQNQGMPAGPAPLLFGLQDQVPPTLSRVVSQAATQSQFYEPEFRRICSQLGMDFRPHRKLWEYVYIVRALEQEGMLQPGRQGLGFGVGKDPMIALMVKAGCEILATDLDLDRASESGWASTNQFAKSLRELNENGLVSDRLLTSRVNLRTVDMNSIPEDLKRGEFDFVWSACAFEHLGSLENGLDFVVESLKCVKPGGVAIHTTEFNVSSNDETVDQGGTVLYRKKDFQRLAERLRAVGGELELNFNIGDQPMDRFYDVPPYSDFNHLKLQIDRYIVTSYGLVIRKR